MNKEQLENMSDFEISANALRSITLKNNGYVVAGIKQSGSMALANVKSGKVMTGISFDINNWSDMGPLIDKHDIDFRSGYETKGVPCALVGDEDDYLHWVSHENILRAAAIVYLLMEQSHE